MVCKVKVQVLFAGKKSFFHCITLTLLLKAIDIYVWVYVWALFCFTHVCIYPKHDTICNSIVSLEIFFHKKLCMLVYNRFAILKIDIKNSLF